jgi:nucleoside-diphosphate-sugar epimerase
MNKVITIIGGNGYVGSRCIETLLKNTRNVKIISVSRSVETNNLNSFNDRVEHIKGDALHPESFIEIIKQSTGIIHTIGKLISLEDKSYEMINYETAIRIAESANNLAEKEKTKKNFVYISAERGFIFPLSIPFGGYINYKRKAEEKLIKDYPNLNPIILRPGLITDIKKRPYLMPLGYLTKITSCFEKNVLENISPHAGEKIGIPASNIELETLSLYAAAGALGKLDMKIYSNDYMNNLDYLSRIKFDV